MQNKQTKRVKQNIPQTLSHQGRRSMKWRIQSGHPAPGGCLCLPPCWKIQEATWVYSRLFVNAVDRTKVFWGDRGFNSKHSRVTGTQAFTDKHRFTMFP